MNLAVTLYNSEQIVGGKAKLLRDANASLALNWRPKPWGQLGAPVITLAGYYQYMFQDALIQFDSATLTPGSSAIPLSGPAKQVLNTRGSIGIGQLRLEIPLGADSGLTFPIAVSYANRTELVAKPRQAFWQGHIGLQYDLEKLASSLFKKKTPSIAPLQ